MFSEAEAYLSKKDPVLKELIKKLGPCALEKRKGHFKQLIRAIISQQISLAAATSIRDRLYERLKNKVEAKNILKLQFGEFRRIGLSSQKTKYILDLSAKINNKELKLNSLDKEEDEVIIQQLTKIKGIGRWTAEMFLIFSLNRLDVMPYDDLGIKRAMKVSYNLKDYPNRSQMEKLSKLWKPYRTVACYYLWKSIE